jgi:hypothetical protein
MSTEDDYRKNAAESIDLAQRATSTRDKGRLLALAEKWLDLSERARKAASRRIEKKQEHPLLKAKLGNHTLNRQD